MVRSLWIITGAAALLMLAATLYLSHVERQQEEAGYAVEITGRNSVIYLREQPDPNSRIVTILELGQQVFVIDFNDEGVIPWAKVRSEDLEGWIPAERVGRGES
ncbi:MAG: SH3 domain-containing protein [Candidatus Promineifilaceae bacterium]|jgi:hypothetical protein